jgi:hypothetical protein
MSYLMAMAAYRDDGAQVYASIASMIELHDALRLRFEELDISRETIEHASGLTPGYASKLLRPVPNKRFGEVSLFLILPVAGLKLGLLEDPEAMRRITMRQPKRNRAQVRHRLYALTQEE